MREGMEVGWEGEVLQIAYVMPRHACTRAHTYARTHTLIHTLSHKKKHTHTPDEAGASSSGMLDTIQESLSPAAESASNSNDLLPDVSAIFG